MTKPHLVAAKNVPFSQPGETHMATCRIFLFFIPRYLPRQLPTTCCFLGRKRGVLLLSGISYRRILLSYSISMMICFLPMILTALKDTIAHMQDFVPCEYQNPDVHQSMSSLSRLDSTSCKSGLVPTLSHPAEGLHSAADAHLPRGVALQGTG